MKTYPLNSETIDMVSEKIGEMYKENGCTTKEILRAKLLLEEALLKYRSRFGEGIELYFRQYKIFGQTRFMIRLKAPEFDPFTLEENPMGFMIQSILSSFENGMPTWKYSNMENEVLFILHRQTKISNLAKIGIAVGIALVLGILARLLFPAEGLSSFVTDFIEPLTGAYAGCFCVMAVILTMLSITLSIIHIGDISVVGAIGGRILKRFYLVTVVLVLVFTVPLLPFFNLNGQNEFNLAAKSIYDILIGFIPVNLVVPFMDFNSVHIMIIGAMFGFSLLVMGQKGETLVKVFDECNYVAVLTNNFLNRLIFIYAGFMVFTFVTTSNFSNLAQAGVMVAILLGAYLLIFLFSVAYACIRKKMSLKKYLRGSAPAMLVGLSSANFGAAFSTVYDSLITLGMDNDTAGLAINLGSVFFQPACTVTMVLSSLFMANSFSVEISWTWVIMAILLSIILVSTMPNIPGASITVITLLFSQLGLPNEALSLMITINALLQFVTVAVDIGCLQSVSTCLPKYETMK